MLHLEEQNEFFLLSFLFPIDLILLFHWVLAMLASVEFLQHHINCITHLRRIIGGISRQRQVLCSNLGSRMTSSLNTIGSGYPVQIGKSDKYRKNIYNSWWTAFGVSSGILLTSVFAAGISPASASTSALNALDSIFPALTNCLANSAISASYCDHSGICRARESLGSFCRRRRTRNENQ